MEKESVSIYRIAKEAGVSPATVSRILTGSARVSQEKRERVMRLIRKYHFRPNALARSLRSAEKNLIGLLVSDIRNPFYSILTVECEEAAYRRGYLLMVCNSLGDNSVEPDYLNKFYSQRVDAVIQIGGKVDELIPDPEYVETVNRMAERMPFLTTGRLEGADCYRVGIDEEKSMELVMEYLHENGHKRILFAGGYRAVRSTADKRRIYREKLKEYGIPVREEYILEGSAYDVEDGERMMADFLDKGLQLPTAVIAINDFTAVGVTHVLRERGIRIPEDISVVSFDNTFITETCVPRLTSVGYDYHAMGELLIGTAVQAIHGPAIHGPAIQDPAIHAPVIHSPEGAAPDGNSLTDAADVSGNAAVRKEIPPRVQMIRPELVVRNSSGKNRSD